MLVPAMETVTLLVANRLNAPASSARVAEMPFTVPEIDAPADDVDDGPTDDSAAFPPHAVTATIIAARMIRFMTPKSSREAGGILGKARSGRAETGTGPF